MRVIGTAGHVDHGKTALIESMTGIDADRLPEEKARGMTVDLGFAWYEDGNGEAVGVVDVPGHERYLRNMVAGAWGLDLVALVVAADDGWMPQTSLHASIVASLAAPAVVIAVTKADAVDSARAAAVAAEASERAAALFGFRPEAILVSNKTGEGIDELKWAVDRALGAAPLPGGGAAYLYVDRTFSPRGGGLVAAGTLVGGSIGVGDELTLLPRGLKARVRSVQSYREERTRAEPSSRTALSLTGLKAEPRRGDVLASADAGLLCGTEFICRLLNLPGTEALCPSDAKGRPLIRPGMEAELALGSAWREAVLWPIAKTEFARVVVQAPLACPPGGAFVVLRRGGAELLCRGQVLRAGATTAQGRKTLQAALARLEPGRYASGPRDAVALRAAIEAYAEGFTELPETVRQPLAADPGLIIAESPPGRRYAFESGLWSTAAEALAAAASEPGGLSRASGESIFVSALDRAGSVDPGRAAAAFSAMIARLEAEGTLVKAGSGWSSPGAARTLTAIERDALKRLSVAGKAGLEPGKTAPQADARVLKALCSFGEAMPLDGGIFFAKAVFDAASEAILWGRKRGERFSVSEAKERSGLSRKYILPLLNRMESLGLVKRSGDERLVL